MERRVGARVLTPLDPVEQDSITDGDQVGTRQAEEKEETADATQAPALSPASHGPALAQSPCSGLGYWSGRDLGLRARGPRSALRARLWHLYPGFDGVS